MSKDSYLTIMPGFSIAYRQVAGTAPGIIFCSGFMSDMQGVKAVYLENFCRTNKRAFVKFDYRGHGQSSGQLQDANISLWLADTLAVIDELTQGPQIIIGSSMGAWIATLVVKNRPERIQQLITIAAAPDFTEDLIWAPLSALVQQRLQQDGMVQLPSAYEQPYPITYQLIEDGRRNLVLRSLLPIQCPVHLFHGMRDVDVPWQTSLKLTEQLQTPDVKLTLIKDGDHRLARPQDLALLAQALMS